MSDNLKDIASKLYGGMQEEVAALVQQSLDQAMAPVEILNGGLIAGMDKVGKDFKAGDLFVPEVLVAARAMKAGMNILRPLLVEIGAPSAGKYLICTVQGDQHDIGKNLVAMMLEGAGFEVIDLGVNVQTASFVDAVVEHKPDIVGMSALLTTTMDKMGHALEALEEVGLRDSVKIMIGGAPVTQAYADRIGADGYAADAATAVDVARSLMG